MKEIFIKYNPYRLTTEILVDNNRPKLNSKLNFGDRRLQEWVEDLANILVEEYNTKDFRIIFHGTILDYEDIEAMARESKYKGINIELEHIVAKEVKDKESAILEVFELIQRGPFEDLKKPDVIKAFELAQSSDFEVNVVATMSSGKSTLVNALLGQKLMPAKQEACTAILTEIKDADKDNFSAIVYDKDGNVIERHDKLDYSIMERLNSDENVSKIRAEGDIPFVGADDISLVLVDTPGPNNSRDKEHRATTYRMLSESSKAVVLYIMNATQLATDDDSTLLKYVAESMKSGGKQSRDRFIFVVNKLDDFKKNEDSVNSALEAVKEYLSSKGIDNPNIYPISALTALNIRTILAQSDDDDDDDDVYEAKYKVRKFNNNQELHLEKYAPLPASVKGIIKSRLNSAEEEGNVNEQALIHSGIVPLEEAIRMYVEKYAKAAKIKNIVDTFITRIESARSFETIKEQIATGEDEANAMGYKIETIQLKLNSGEEAKKFKEKINSLNYSKSIEKTVGDIYIKAQEKITEQFDTDRGDMSQREARAFVKEFKKFTDELQADMKVKLGDLIENNVQKASFDLFETYKQKLLDMVEELDVSGIEISPFDMMAGDIPISYDELIEDSIVERRVEVGTQRVKNENKHWWNFFSWFEPAYYEESVYDTKEFIDGEALAQKFLAQIQESLYNNCEKTKKYANEQTEIIKENFAKKFEELDRVLKYKLDELQSYINDRDKVEKQLEDMRNKLTWLEDIQKRVDAILDI